MHVKSISIAGYLGVPPDEAKKLMLEGLGRHNILIGPNNSGKSIVVRFLHYLKQFADKTELGVGTHAANTMLREFFWEQDTTHPITATIALAVPDGTIQGGEFVYLVSENTTRFRFACEKDGARLSTVLMPLVCSDGKWHDAFRGEGSPRHCFERNGQYTTQSNAKDWAETFRRLLSGFCSNAYFFDSVRSLDRGRSDNSVDDGSRLLGELSEFSGRGQNIIEWSLFVDCLCRRINDVFRPCGLPEVHRIEMKKGERDVPQMWLYFNSKPGRPVNLQMMGTGIAQIVIMLAAITRGTDENRVIVAEELETHLHPALLRGFLKVIRDDTSSQFIITTHSPTVIEDVRKEDRIYRFWQDPIDLRCSASECREAIALHESLDDLGIRGSDLLQANCVLWVEGPSDRLYLRRWIRETEPQLVEGRDFVFVFYGGALLAHCTLDLNEEEMEEFVQILKVCRFSAVLADRDAPRHLGNDGLAPRKQRVAKAAEIDPAHRLFVVTNGREIENDIPLSALLDGVARLTRKPRAAFDAFTLDPDAEYSRTIAQKFGGGVEESERLRKKLDDKVRLARDVLSAWEKIESSEQDCPEYVRKIVALVKRSQGKHELSN